MILLSRLYVLTYFSYLATYLYLLFLYINGDIDVNPTSNILFKNYDDDELCYLSKFCKVFIFMGLLAFRKLNVGLIYFIN